MKEFVAVLIGGVAGLAVLAVLALAALGLGWFGLITGRPMAKYAEETRTQTYDSSRQFQQGTNRDLARYCRDYRDAPESGKRAVADLIRTTADTYQGPLTPGNQACLSEIGR